MLKLNLTKTNLTLIVILLVATLLRFYNLTAIALWHDEAFSALLIRYPIREMIDRIILDVHPPLYYLVLRIWDIIFSDSLLSLRFFSAFFGILTVYFSYLFAKEAFKNDKLALITAALIAFNPFQIQYSVESRMYTFGTFLIVLSSWLLVKALETQNASGNKIPENACASSIKKCDWLSALKNNEATKKNILSGIIAKIQKYKWWILYGLSAAAAIYTHYYLMFSVAAQALFIVFIILKKYKKNIAAAAKDEITRGAIIAYLLAFILFIPWLGIFLAQLGQVDANYWIPKMDRYSIPNTIFHLFAGSNIYTANADLIIISIVFLAISIFALKKEKNSYKWLVAFSFFIPFMIAAVLSSKRSLYLDRYFVFTGLFYCMIGAIFVNSIGKKTLQNALLGILMLSSVLFFTKGWQKIDISGRPGMAGASNYIFTRAAPDEKVYVGSTFIFFTYKYYAYQNFYQGSYPSDFNPSSMIEANNIFAGERLYPEYLTPRLYTPGLSKLSDIPHFSGTALLTDNDLLTDFSKNIKRGESVWILWTTGFGGSKPEIPKNWRQTDEAWYLDVFDYKGWIVATRYRIL